VISPAHGLKLGECRALVDELSIRHGLHRGVIGVVLKDFVETLARTVWEVGRVNVPGLGAFRVKQRKARRIVKPNGERGFIKLPAHRVATCRVASSWRVR